MSDAAEPAKAQAVAEDPALRDCLYLLTQGVPFDVAFSLDPTMRLAWCVILGEIAGGEFSWARMAWEQREA